MAKKHFIWEFLRHLFYLLIICAVGVALSFLFQVWNGYPRGSDATTHLFFIENIERFYPHHNWVYVWAAGMPAYLWYPSLLHHFVALIHFVTNLDNRLLLTSTAIFSLIIASMAIYGTVWTITKQRLIAFVLALIFLSTPSIWSIAFSAGAYPRAFSIIFVALSLFFGIRLFLSLNIGKFSKFDYVLTIISLALAIFSHFFFGPITFIAIFIFSLFLIKGWGQKIIWFFKITIPSILLSASFTFPFVFLRAPGSIFVQGQINYDPKHMFASWADLINDGHLFVRYQGWDDLWSLTPFILPIILFLLIIVLLKSKPLTSIFWSYLVISLLFLIYSKFPLPIFNQYYGSGIFDPKHAVQIMPLFLIPLIGILWYSLFNKSIFRFTSLLILIGLFLWLPYKYQFNIYDIKFSPFEHNMSLANTLKKYLPEKEFNFRIGTGNYLSIASWFNRYFPYTPQTRDVFATGVVIPDDYFYLVQAGWIWDDNPIETNFLFDWWGVKYFVVDPKDSADKKFVENAKDFQYLETDSGFKIYQYQNPSPIMAQSPAPTVLVIGEKQSYDLLFRSLAPANLNSRYFIPVKGSVYIDDIKADELKKFKILFLYNFKWRNAAAAKKILGDYLEQGGAVFVEENKSKDKSLQLSLSSISDVQEVGFGTDWQLGVNAEGKKILGNPDFSQFAAPVFEKGPWRMIQANEVASPSQVLLTNFGQPILVSEQKGRGRVVWSGMNLPYHIVNYKNREESQMLGHLLAYLAGEEKLALATVQPGIQDSTVQFINPQERLIKTVPPSRGVLLKEAYFKDWHAFVDGQEVKIYPAGSGFMYVPFKNNSENHEVRFVYKKSFFPEIVGIITSLLTGLVLIWYLIEDKLRIKPLAAFGRLFAFRFNKVKKTGQQWWDREEE